MEMLCPECLTPLEVRGNTAYCPAHRISFQVLFSREPMTAVAVPRAAAWPATAASMSAQPVAASSEQDDVYDLAPGPAAPRVPPRPVLGMACPLHPESPAVGMCQGCGIAMCATCEFVLPGNLRLCPKCAANPNPTVSSKRKRLIGWSIALAILGTLAIAAFFLAAATQSFDSDKSAEAAATGLFNVVIICGLVGVGLGAAAHDRRLKNPGIVWVGIIWNAVILGLMVVMMIVGLFAMA